MKLEKFKLRDWILSRWEIENIIWHSHKSFQKSLSVSHLIFIFIENFMSFPLFIKHALCKIYRSASAIKSFMKIIYVFSFQSFQFKAL
jgi:hypothetical protein